MSKEFFENPTCTMKAKIYLNRDGNVLQPGETIAGQKTVTFSNFASSIPASETVNDENSSALHNGVAGLIWLLSGTDENFDTNVEKHSVEVVDDE